MTMSGALAASLGLAPTDQHRCGSTCPGKGESGLARVLASRRIAALDDYALAPIVDCHHGTASRSVDGATNEDWGKRRFLRYVRWKCRAHPEIGQAFVPQIIEQKFRLARYPGDPFEQLFLEPNCLWPRLVQCAVRQAVNPGRQKASDVLGAVASENCFVAICDDQVEWIEVCKLRSKEIGIRALARKDVPYKGSARDAFRVWTAIAPEIGDNRETALLGNAEPGTSRLQIPTSEHVCRLMPSRQGFGWTSMQLITIAGNDQRPAGMSAPRECQDTHECVIASPAVLGQQ